MDMITRTNSIQNNQLESRAAGAPLHNLRRFAQQRQSPLANNPAQVPLEHCDLCQTPLPGEHHHLLDLAEQHILCACQACALLFETESTFTARYRAVPERYLTLPNFIMTDEQWDALMIPVNMAFFFYSSKEARVKVFYPGPAGATESLLHMEHWAELVANNPALQLLVPDVEALLVNRLEPAGACYIVPIDSCYRLVGTIRTYWRGLSGGSEVWEAIHSFFADLQARARSVNASEQESLSVSEGGSDA